MKKLYKLISLLLLVSLLAGCAGLNSKLVSEDENIRQQAIEEINSLNDKAKTETALTLRAYLNNQSSSVRNRATEAIVKLGPDAAIPVFIDALYDKEVVVRIAAEEQLVKFDQKALPALLKTLDSTDVFARTHSAYAIGAITPSTAEVVNKLFTLLGDENKHLDAAARDALFKTGMVRKEDILNALKSDNVRLRCGGAFLAGKKAVEDKEIVEQLINCLEHPHVLVRNAAEVALIEIGAVSKNSVDIMLQRFKGGTPELKVVFIYIFGKLGQAANAALPELTGVVNMNELLAPYALDALAKIDNKNYKVLEVLCVTAVENNVNKRIAAIRAIGKMRSGYSLAETTLVKAFSDEVVFVRDEAVKSFISIASNNTSSGALLKKCFSDKDRRVRTAAVDAVSGLLGSIPDDYSADVALLLKDEDFQVQSSAALATGRLGLKGLPAVNSLILLLGSHSSLVRYSAKDALENLGIRSAAVSSAIIPFLSDSNQLIALESKNILIKIGTKSIQPLINAFKDKNPEVRAISAAILGKIGIEKGSPLMKEATTNLIAILKDPFPKVRVAGASSLGEIGIEYKEVISALVEALKDEDDNVRFTALESLGKIGPGAKSASPFMVKTLKDKSNKVANKAREAIVRLGNEAVPYLIELLKDPDAEVRTAAIMTLNSISTSEALEAVRDYKLKNK